MRMRAALIWQCAMRRQDWSLSTWTKKFIVPGATGVMEWLRAETDMEAIINVHHFRSFESTYCLLRLA